MQLNPDFAGGPALELQEDYIDREGECCDVSRRCVQGLIPES